MSERNVNAVENTLASWSKWLKDAEADWSNVAMHISDGSSVVRADGSGEGTAKGEPDEALALLVQWDKDGKKDGKPVKETLGKTIIPHNQGSVKLREKIGNELLHAEIMARVEKTATALAQAWARKDESAKTWLHESGRRTTKYYADGVAAGLKFVEVKNMLSIKLTLACGENHTEDINRNRQIFAAQQTLSPDTEGQTDGQERFALISIKGQKALGALFVQNQPDDKNPIPYYTINADCGEKEARRIWSVVIGDAQPSAKDLKAIGDRKDLRDEHGVMFGEIIETLSKEARGISAKPKPKPKPQTPPPATATPSTPPAGGGVKDEPIKLAEKPTLAAAQLSTAIQEQAEGAAVVLEKLGNTIGTKKGIQEDALVAMFMGILRSGRDDALAIGRSVMNKIGQEFLVYELMATDETLKGIKDEHKRRVAALNMLASGTEANAKTA